MLNQDLFAGSGLTLALLVLLYWHLKPTEFDLTDLICTNGKLNDKKFIRFGSWVVMTWGFYAMVEDGKLTEWYVGVYGALWVGNAALHQWLTMKEKPND